MSSNTNQVDRFCRQYLQLQPELDYPEPALLKTSQVQDEIYERLFAEGAVRYGPPPRFQLRVLKELMSRIEASIDDWEEYGVSDDLMSVLSLYLANPVPSETTSAQRKAYVTYYLSELCQAGAPTSETSQTPQITILENQSLLSGSGTTGLRTWEAALPLGSYLCRNSHIVKDKRILELGVGTGYISILCAKFLGSQHVIASDGSDDVINNLPDNLFLNDLQDSALVTPMEVKWGHALMGTEEEKWNGGRPIDVVLGADITYDKRVVPALIGTLVDVFGLNPHVEVFISAAERNEKTFQAFLSQCRANGLTVEVLQSAIQKREVQQGPFYDDTVAIHICKIHKS
ncbi:hypothetical protein HG530_000565 [Fusarium avenaceum]|nr:putative methyltransferase-domain-containing protein [Fusarium avenaceum]KAI6776620.1 hypothetical protein HG530_000565 [Fusarium avenaceum]